MLVILCNNCRLSGITSPWEICYTHTQAIIIVLSLSFIKFLAIELSQYKFKGVVFIRILNFISALMETIWSVIISFVVGISMSPRAYIGEGKS